MWLACAGAAPTAAVASPGEGSGSGEATIRTLPRRREREPWQWRFPVATMQLVSDTPSAARTTRPTHATPPFRWPSSARSRHPEGRVGVVYIERAARRGRTSPPGLAPALREAALVFAACFLARRFGPRSAPSSREPAPSFDPLESDPALTPASPACRRR